MIVEISIDVNDNRYRYYLQRSISATYYPPEDFHAQHTIDSKHSF